MSSLVVKTENSSIIYLQRIFGQEVSVAVHTRSNAPGVNALAHTLHVSLLFKESESLGSKSIKMEVPGRGPDVPAAASKMARKALADLYRQAKQAGLFARHAALKQERAIALATGQGREGSGGAGRL
jgi:hypothetical protein